MSIPVFGFLCDGPIADRHPNHFNDRGFGGREIVIAQRFAQEVEGDREAENYGSKDDDDRDDSLQYLDEHQHNEPDEGEPLQVEHQVTIGKRDGECARIHVYGSHLVNARVALQIGGDKRKCGQVKRDFEKVDEVQNVVDGVHPYLDDLGDELDARVDKKDYRDI